MPIENLNFVKNTHRRAVIIEFQDARKATLALQLNGVQLCGNALRVGRTWAAVKDAGMTSSLVSPRAGQGP